MSELISLEKIAEEIGNKHGDDYVQVVGIQDSLTRRLREAALNGKLSCFDSFGRCEPKAHEGVIFTTAEAVNDWLVSIESLYRYGDGQTDISWKNYKPEYATHLMSSQEFREWWPSAWYFAEKHKTEDKDGNLGHTELSKLVFEDFKKKGINARGKNEPPQPVAIIKSFKGIDKFKKDSKHRKRL